MKKKLLCLLLGAAMSLSTLVFAGAADMQAAYATDAAAAFAIETALRQPMDAQTHEALLQNDTLFEQVLVDEQMIQNEDGTQGVLKTYEFIPKFQTRGNSNTCYPMVEYVSNNNDDAYARLYAIFTYNGSATSCIERSAEGTLPGYRQVALSTSGNGTSKATATLDYTWTPMRGSGDRRLSVTCDKNGLYTKYDKVR